MERDAFLSRVRTSVAAATVPAASSDPPTPRADSGDLAAQFRTALEAVDGIVHEVDAAEDVPGLVQSIAAAAGAQRFLSWGADRLPVRGVIEGLTAFGLHRMSPLVPQDGADRLDHQRAYFDVDLGVTGAYAGFAESGSIVLTAGPGRPRMASLIPPLHVALLMRRDLHPSLSTWAATEPNAPGETSNLIFITGPSRTGDIEMHLNLGVHGPKEIHVVVISEA